MKRIYIFIFILLFGMPAPSGAQTWEAVGSGLAGDVHGFGIWNNQLAIGGSFNNNPCDKITGWDSLAYNCFGAGIGSVVRAVIGFNGDLIAVGDFWNINQPCPDCNGVARWNGTQWVAMGTGFNNDVLCLAVWNGELVAGGDFTTADGNPCWRLAHWNGTQWLPFGTTADTINNDVRALTVYNGQLWIGGDFSNAGGCGGCDRIARWNGTFWQGVGIPGGLDSTVRVLYVDAGSNVLYLGGHFIEVGGNTNARGVAKYNGTSWSALGTGTNDYVRAISKYNGNIIVGGNFTQAGAITANKVARWSSSTSTWSAMGTGMNGYLRALREYKSELYAGGEFTQADGQPRNYIAKWYESPSSPPTANFSMSSNSICMGQCVGFVNNSTGNITSWSWTFPTGTPSSSTLQSPPNVCFNTAGTYTVTLRACTLNGCDSMSHAITVYANPTTANAGTNKTVCFGKTVTLAGNTPAVGTGLWTLVSGAATITTPASPASTVTGLGAGTVVLQWTISNGTCTSSSDQMSITVNPLPTANAGTDVTICMNGSAQLNATGGVGYQWLPSTGLNCTNCSNPVAAPPATTAYIVIVTDANNCTNTDTVIVMVDPCTGISAAEGKDEVKIYPNPTSGVFNLKMEQFENLKMKSIEIYNVCGKKVYDNSHFQINSSSTLNQVQGQIDLSFQPSGIYFLKFTADDFSRMIKIVKAEK